MKKVLMISITLLLIGCKGSQERSIVINAPVNEVWAVFSDLGGHEHFTALDSASLSPSGEVSKGAVWYVSQGKYFGKSEITVVEPMKKIETKLICEKIFKLNCRKLLVEGGLKTQELFLKDNLINEFLIVKSEKNFSENGRIKASKLYKNIKIKFKSKKFFRLNYNKIFRYYS